ncbi:MAG: LysE family transporter [Candidatus Competibacteraceae bacterium]|nr:LysE family transporter [Candidatus Competibacteraceae bacterium]
MLLWLKGMLIGLAIAAPVGPTGLLCIQRTLTRGRWSGVLSGLGAASADALYGGIAGFGLASLSGLLLAWQIELQVVGGLFLLYLGWQTWQTPPIAEQVQARPTRAGLVSDYLSTLALTATNPVTILAFVGVFTGLGLAAVGQDFVAASTLVFGVFAGSLLWWVLLTGGVGLMRGRLSASVLHGINYVSGLMIGGFGVWALLAALQALLQV